MKGKEGFEKCHVSKIRHPARGAVYPESTGTGFVREIGMNKPLALLLSVGLLCFTGCAKRSGTAPGALDSTKPTLSEEQRAVQVTIQLTNRPDTSHTGMIDTVVHSSDNIKTFAPRDTIKALIRTENAVEGMTLIGRWYFVPTYGKIAENRATLLGGTNVSHFEMLNNKPWVQGAYKLVIFLDSVAKDSAQFTVGK
jgi:hypothetical protein